MCGRYSLGLRPSQVRAYLENEHMPVAEAPDDDGDDVPRQSYNFAPGYHGIVYRADTPYWGAGPREHKKGENGSEGHPEPETAGVEGPAEVRYKLQTMSWGLVPFWTKRNPDYASKLKTINARDDSLMENRGMWNTMKQKKRCIVIAQGFYEWLKKGKEKVPHYTKRKDGQLMCFAGLWDCVQYEGSEEKLYSYTVITTSSNKQLNFLHDRMPVILENGSEDIRIWLDPNRFSWSKELQSLLKPFEGELECYPVSKEVGKVGNNSPTFIIPVASSENKSNIANFFAKGSTTKDAKSSSPTKSTMKDVVSEKQDTKVKMEPVEDRETLDHECTEDNAPLPVPKEEVRKGVKRELDDVSDSEHLNKVPKTSPATNESSTTSPSKRTRSATANIKASPKKIPSKEKSSQKITSFFGK